VVRLHKCAPAEKQFWDKKCSTKKSAETPRFFVSAIAWKKEFFYSVNVKLRGAL